MIARGTLNSAERSALATIAVCIALLAVTTLAFLIDERLLRGVNVWSKPVKFAASFGLHLATLLLFATWLASEARHGRIISGVLVAASVATLIEVLYVTLQSARGRASHFNTQTPLESFMYYQVMGSAALVLVAATFAVGVLVLRHGRSDLTTGLRLGAGWGAILSGMVTLPVAGLMASGAVSGAGPWIGEPRNDAGGLPLVGWSRSAGDLRVPHFIATHLIQLLPLVGWTAERLSLPRAFSPARLVTAASGVGVALVAWTTMQAVGGHPFFR